MDWEKKRKREIHTFWVRVGNGSLKAALEVRWFSIKTCLGGWLAFKEETGKVKGKAGSLPVKMCKILP